MKGHINDHEMVVCWSINHLASNHGMSYISIIKRNLYQGVNHALPPKLLIFL